MIMSQGSYHRDSVEGEWNYTIDEAAGPEGKGEDYIDWKMWIGKAPYHPFDADRFFRFRKYWIIRRALRRTCSITWWLR